jgi:hypothetical protein
MQIIFWHINCTIFSYFTKFHVAYSCNSPRAGPEGTAWLANVAHTAKRSPLPLKIILVGNSIYRSINLL